MLLTKDGTTRSALVVGANATWLERHAADELTRYLHAISGAEIPVTENPPAKGTLVAIGRAETNPLIADAIRTNHLTLSETYPGRDGFLIETITLDGREVLVLGGSTDRGTLYAAYALLEEVLGVGFFRDGERIPNAPTIRLPELHLTERPYFAEREDGNGCFYHYSASAWDWEDWKREFDWKAKRRVNIVWPLNVGGGIMGAILHEWGVLPQPPPPPKEPSLHERVFEYTHKLGMRIPCILPSGSSMPEAFYKAFPNCRTLLMQWSELAPYRQLHPADPLFRRLIVDYVRHYRARWGTDHLYIAEFASESRVLEGAEDVQEVRLDFARAMSDALKEADPQAVWVPSSWSFDLSADDPGNPWQANWTVEEVREYLDAISLPLVVWDLWSEEAEKYLRTDYFYGHPWGFGVLHSFGAGSYLHGDVRGLINRVHRLINEPKAKNCDLFLTQEEIVHYNGFFFELCAQLSWNPIPVTFERYLATYCRRRYGAEAGKSLEPAWRHLVDTVYGPESGTVKIILDPLYWFRPDLELLHGWPEDAERSKALWARRPAFVPRLRSAVEIFLSQPDLLRTNEMARRDLVDIASQWISERFSLALIRARDAFLGQDAGAFEDAAKVCLRLLDEKTRLLASWPPYRLDRKVERERKNWGDDASRATKHTHVWVTYEEDQHSVPLRDYYRMDLDGLVADYYKPRVAAYLDLLRRKLASGETKVSAEEFDALYTPIEEGFIAAPVRSLPEGEDPVAIVRELIAAGPDDTA